MTVRQKNVLIFFASLLISLLVFGSIFFFFLHRIQKSRQTDSLQEDVPYLRQYQPTSQENLSLLLIGCKKAESLPGYLVLFHYDAPQGILTAMFLPAETLVTSEARRDTLAGHYEYAGIKGCVRAVGALLGQEPERYLRLQKKGISNLCDYFGGADYDLKEDVVIDGQTILKGAQRMDGRRIAGFLFEPDSSGRTDLERQAEFTYRVLQNGLNAEAAEEYGELASVLFYNAETNLNQYDFVLRQQGFSERLASDSLVIRSILLEGEYSEEEKGLVPSRSSMDEILGVLG